MEEKFFSDNNLSKILIREDNALGYSYYIDDDDYLYYDDEDDWYYYDYDDDDWYYDSYSGYYDNYYDNYVDSYLNNYYGNYYGNYYNNYYDGLYNYYYDDWYDDDYWYDDDDYWYDDDYNRNKKYRLTISGDTLKVGSEYDNNIWLNNATGSLANVRVIDGSDNDKNLFITGNSRSNSIISGKGITTLWGAGGGQNTLVGGARRNYFWYEGNSRDVATKFGTGDTEYSDVVVLSNVNYSSINRDSASITFRMADGNYIQLQPEGASYDDDPIFFSRDGGASVHKCKIAQDTTTSLNYRDDVNLFYFNQPGQIMVSGSNHHIWLGGDSGQNFVNVTTINGGASSGYNVMMGNDQPNVIIGGSGVSTLWGGTGLATDTLIGGQGPEIFRAGRFEGSDAVYTNEGHDVIFLYDTNLSDITSVEVSGDLVAIGFNSGTFLNVHNSAEVTPIFQLANGERYNYNRSTQQWQGA